MQELLGSVKRVDMNETTKEKDFKGQWKTRAGYLAEVEASFLNYWFGFIEIGNLRVPSWWDSNGESAEPKFTLMKHRCGVEEWKASVKL